MGCVQPSFETALTRLLRMRSVVFRILEIRDGWQHRDTKSLKLKHFWQSSVHHAS
jgi:hypothetical protein